MRSVVDSELQNEELAKHLDSVVKALTERRVIPFLGAAVNLCDRPPGFRWTSDQHEYLPGGPELSKYLAEEFHYPESNTEDLIRVSSYVGFVEGDGPLYETLHNIFRNRYPPRGVHRLLAKIPGVLREKGYRSSGDPDVTRYIVVTTNYDCILEQAFKDAGESFHLLWYINDKGNSELKGKFFHSPPGLPPGGQPVAIKKPDEYLAIKTDPDQRPIILKIHGAIDPRRGEFDIDNDYYVITEEDYVDYLTRIDLAQFLCPPLTRSFQKNHFLFLGYSLRDWNMRAMLYRLWHQRRRAYKSWAIQIQPSIIDKKFWEKMDVGIIECDLHHYVDLLDKRITNLESARGEP